jgi:PKD repeat protein
MVNVMCSPATRLLLILLCILSPTCVSATTSQTIQAEWNSYTPPAGRTVTAFKLYQEGLFVCQTTVRTATAMDCTVMLTNDTTNFTLTAVFDDGTESPHSSPTPYTLTSPGSSDTSPESPDNSTGTGTTVPDPTFPETPPPETADPDPTEPDSTTPVSSPTDDTTPATTEPDPTAPSTDDSATPGTGASGLHTIQPEWSSYTPPEGLSVTAFKLYQDGVFVCQTTDSAATTMDCQVTLSGDTASFTLSALLSDGTETPHSSPIPVTLDPAPPVTAAISADTLSGTTPLTVSFSAAASLGAVVSYDWNFGGGATANGSTVSHVFTTAGTHTVTLTVADSQGLTSTATVAVSVASAQAPEPEPTPAIPPSAVISSSTAMGPAPLQVTFDGTGSKAASGASITGYAWSFGDGSTTTGASAAHSYTKAGTYTASLTVTDTQGLTNSASTPIVVTAPVVIENKPPTAVATATPTSGTVPLTVSFDGSQSADSDGSIATYEWTFGDGSTADGKTASHAYIGAGDYTATLIVTDDKGATGTTTVIIKAEAANALAGLNIETGEISVGSDWVRVKLAGTFTEPVVIAGPPSTNDTQPCVIRVRNVTTDGFDIRLAEWDYLDGTHSAETVSYLVMDKGRTSLPDGSIVEAGSFAGTPTNQNVRFSGLFNTIPVVLTTIASENEIDTVSSRTSKITTASFAYSFKEQEKNKNQHVKETVHYIAWEPGQGTIGTLRYEVALAPDGLTDAWQIVPFQQPFARAPLFLADMQTTNDKDTAALRARAFTPAGAPLKVEEERSRDAETAHPAETVGFMAFDQVE